MDEGLQTPEGDESAHTTGRKSARSRRVEIITRGERRRSWTPEQKREIVAESLGPELSPTEVARKHGISTGQLYTWRRDLLDMPSAVTARGMPRFAEVERAPAPPDTSAPPQPPADGHAPPGVPVPARSGGTIEIMLPGGVSLRVDARVDGPALRRVLDALDRR
jgi:transposase